MLGTFLHDACGFGNDQALIAFLIDAGADLRAVDFAGRTPLD